MRTLLISTAATAAFFAAAVPAAAQTVRACTPGARGAVLAAAETMDQQLFGGLLLAGLVTKPPEAASLHALSPSCGGQRFYAAGREYVLAGGGGEILRWAVEADGAEGSFAWVTATEDGAGMSEVLSSIMERAEGRPDSSPVEVKSRPVYALLTRRGTTTAVQRIYRSMPSDPVLIRDMRAALEGKLRPVAVSGGGRVEVHVPVARQPKPACGGRVRRC